MNTDSNGKTPAVQTSGGKAGDEERSMGEPQWFVNLILIIVIVRNWFVLLTSNGPYSIRLDFSESNAGVCIIRNLKTIFLRNETFRLRNNLVYRVLAEYGTIKMNLGYHEQGMGTSRNP